MSVELVIPEGRDLEAMSPRERWDLYDAAEEWGKEARNAELRAYHAEGLNDREIGERVGRSPQRIQQLRSVLELPTNSPRGRPANNKGLVIQGPVGIGPVQDAEIVDGEGDWADDEDLPPSVAGALANRDTPIQGPVRPVGNKTIAGVKFPRGGIAETEDLTAYNTRNLKVVAENLIRRATPQEAVALHALFIKYAQMAEGKIR